MSIVEQIKNFVEEECKKPTSNYGYEPFVNHFTPVAKYCEELANQLNADVEIVLLAAWLHDIGSIQYGRDDHHFTSAKIAQEKLAEFNYPQEKIDIVKKCILNHRGSQDNNRESVEEQILVDADTISAFDNLAGLFKAAFVYEKKTQDEARDSVREKLENKWNQLHFENSKKMLEQKYEAAMLLLK
ncbi:HD domain-containing protein [Candidatus Woesearchaeota archaeon]|nr:HD domain-containing protein [Candidatus Woesearchaeota archaeon]